MFDCFDYLYIYSFDNQYFKLQSKELFKDQRQMTLSDISTSSQTEIQLFRLDDSMKFFKKPVFLLK